MKGIFSHPLGSPFATHALSALEHQGMLTQVTTTVDVRSILRRLLFAPFPEDTRNAIRRHLERRHWLKGVNTPVITSPFRELIRLCIEKTVGASLPVPLHQRLVDWVYCGNDILASRSIETANPDFIYAYEDGALESFRRAKERGVRCIYDLPILFHDAARAIQSREAALYPELTPYFAALHESQRKREQKDEEVRLADVIIVASSATKESLISAGVAPDKVRVVPYGVDTTIFSPPARRNPENTFRVLFVGRISPRKGAHRLLDAWRTLSLPHAELVLIGPLELPPSYVEGLPSSVTLLPPRPQAEISQLYRNADLLVFPSLVEGFGMVILEAMASGLPVLTTDVTAAPDMISHGKDGFIIPAGDNGALVQQIQKCVADRNALHEIGVNARATAERYSWNRYEKHLVKELAEALS